MSNKILNFPIISPSNIQLITHAYHASSLSKAFSRPCLSLSISIIEEKHLPTQEPREEKKCLNEYLEKIKREAKDERLLVWALCSMILFNLAGMAKSRTWNMRVLFKNRIKLYEKIEHLVYYLGENQFNY